jgi:hypothetical protein
MADQYDTLKKIISTAKISKCWIFNSATKTWFTPEELSEAVSSKRLELTAGWEQFYKIMNPQKGLAAAEIQLQQLNAKKVAFQQKVIDYYQQQT